MRKAWTAGVALAFLLGVVAIGAAVAPQDASAQIYRQFTGRVDKISDKKFIIDNRKGDKVTFNRVDETSVEGQGKSSWDDLQKGDWVTVDWLFVDKPRRAYKVQVIPEPPDAAEDE